MMRFLMLSLLAAIVNTSGAYADSANVASGEQGKVVWPQGQCFMVDNDRSDNMFVPYKTSGEWGAFDAKHPSRTRVDACCAQATANICGQDNTIPLSRTGTTVKVTVQKELETGQCYQAQCLNLDHGSWRTLRGTAAASNILYTRSPSEMGAWVVQYDMDATASSFDVYYSCNQHSWSVAGYTDTCTTPIPPSAFRVSRAVNCFPDHVNPPYDSYRVSGYGPCQTYAPLTGPHRQDFGQPFGYPSTFYNGWGRSNLLCYQPTRC